jgi:hypothetical protein
MYKIMIISVLCLLFSTGVAKLWFGSHMRLFWTISVACGESISQPVIYEWIKYKKICSVESIYINIYIMLPP